VRVFVLGSGSNGNCLVLDAEGERLLVDAGMGPTRAVERMRALGEDLITERKPRGLFVTHDHADHAAHALSLARALRAPLFAHDRAPLERARRKMRVCSYAPGRAIPLGPFVVESLAVPHDAPHVALRVSAEGRKVAIVTDVGHSTRELRAFLASCDMVLLEANHCRQMLEEGPYPSRLKARVGGPLGHLANEQAGDLAASLENTRVARLVLIHLSRVNNSPERALEVVRSRARRLAVEVVPNGLARRLDVPRGPQQLLLNLALGPGSG
jgi:phosphoribosyl 1,2-cyclic phosphodiesterase